MGRDVPFKPDAICDDCGAKGAYDFMGDFICQECMESVGNDMMDAIDGAVAALKEQGVDEIEKLKAENERLRGLVREMATEIEIYADLYYPHRNVYPGEMLKWELDMDVVCRAHAALKESEMKMIVK